MNTSVGLLLITFSVCCLMQITNGKYITDNKRSPSDVFKLIHETVNKTQYGIRATDLKSAAQLVIASDNWFTKRVSQRAAIMEILEAGTKINLEQETKALLNWKQNDSDRFNSNIKTIGVALKIWEALADKGENLKGDLSKVMAATSVLSYRIIRLLDSVSEDLTQRIYGREAFSGTENYNERFLTEDSQISKRPPSGKIEFDIGSIHVTISW